VVFPVERRLYDSWDFAARSILGKAQYKHARDDAEAMRMNDVLFTIAHSA
jgi:hypothetical protein